MPATADRPSLGEVDRHVAARLRRRRLELGLTRHQLAGLLGISPQQAHKYETRASLLPADRLAAVAAALGVGATSSRASAGTGRPGRRRGSGRRSSWRAPSGGCPARGGRRSPPWSARSRRSRPPPARREAGAPAGGRRASHKISGESVPCPPDPARVRPGRRAHPAEDHAMTAAAEPAEPPRPGPGGAVPAPARSTPWSGSARASAASRSASRCRRWRRRWASPTSSCTSTRPAPTGSRPGGCSCSPGRSGSRSATSSAGTGRRRRPTGQRRMLLDLVRNFARIPDRQQREAVARLARTLAGLDGRGAALPRPDGPRPRQGRTR